MFLHTLLASFGTTLNEMFHSAWNMVLCIWGGLVVWVVFVLTKWILNRSRPRRR